MIDMQLFLTLMGAETCSDRLIEDDKLAFLDNRTIDEQGIKAMPVEAQTFQLLTKAEREQLTMDEITSELKFPCSLAEFRTWIINNGYKDLVDWPTLKNENEGIKKIAKIKGERLRIRVSDMCIDDLISQNIRPPHGNIDLLSELYCWRAILKRKIKNLNNDRQSSLSDIEQLKAKLIQKIQEIDHAVATPLDTTPTNNAPQIKPQDTTRSNALHKLIAKVDSHLHQRHNRRPKAIEIWRELRDNHDLHDDEGIIQEVTNEEIAWCSAYGNESSMKQTSFNAVLSKLRNQNKS